ncbi:ribosome biogenesis GTP-binding protein YsxC [Candidatus Falkowbacteria bacterium]|nr:ribosome biogenesis GTP-binding protein YsxC [Candidatus Falkowbacteria bacterium]
MKNFNRQNIVSATFVKGVVEDCEELKSGIPQVAFIGRSNVGKSSIINYLTKQKDLARISSSPGRTQEINLFLINKSLYLADLPGYGFVKASRQARDRLEQLINWYLFLSGYEQKLVVLIIDAALGLIESDLEILESLMEYKKNVIIVANKIDKIKKSDYEKQLEKIQNQAAGLKIIPYSAKKKISVNRLISEVLCY